MAAESGGTKKPPRSTKATPKKPARRASAAAAKPAKSTSAAAAKPAKSASSGAAAKPATRAPSRKPAKVAAGAARGAPSRAPAKRAVVKATARSYFDALAARDASAAAQAWDGEGVNDLVPLGIFRGQAAIRGLFEEMFAAVPDARFTVERLIADDKAAAVQWRLAGTFTGASFQGLDPTGRRVDLRGTDCLEIEDGRIMHNTGVFDGAAFARQVGLLPAEDSGADRVMRAGFNAVTKLRRTVARRTDR